MTRETISFDIDKANWRSLSVLEKYRGRWVWGFGFVGDAWRWRCRRRFRGSFGSVEL
jgi:hypothetical protein